MSEKQAPEVDEHNEYFDIYVRFNEDMEKDYCFQIKTTTTFRDLFKIFNTLPIALRPSIFYEAKPVGFEVSTSPGYLTEDGNFIFEYDAHKQTKKIANLDDKVSQHVWPGQLILPVWVFNDFGFYSTIAALATWLYTDLPDFISPTPGICLTNTLSQLAAKVAIHFGYPNVANTLVEDIGKSIAIPGQLIFFVFHLLKIAAIFGLLYSGMFNPVKLLRFARKNIRDEITKEELIELGWTGTRKATPDEYNEYFREYKIKEHGGMIQAHRAGLFDIMKNLGCHLGPGEGYNTPIEHKGTFKELLDQALDEENPTFKLELNFEYFGQLGLLFTQYVDDKEGSELTDYIKQYRRYGLLYSNDNIKKIVEKRKHASVANKLDK